MKKIPLTRGKFALVDDEDYKFLMQWKWQANKKGYAQRTEYRGEYGPYPVWMHRVVNNTPDELLTDHRDGDKLNNQRHNLRNATNVQNCRNAKSHKGSSSRFKGVCFHKVAKTWDANIRINGKLKYLGRFDIEEDAARAYNEAALEFFGEFAALNKIV